MISPIPNLSEVLSKVEHVELKALRALDSMRAGHFRSVFLGHGMEFDQVREYVPGDDVRHMDWSATARTGRPFVKVHVEERDLCVALDVPCADDGVFCNGEETCDEESDVCLRAAVECGEGERCDEEIDECAPVAPVEDDGSGSRCS